MKKEMLYHEKRIKELHGFAKLLYQKPILKFVILVIVHFILINFSSYIPDNFPARFILDVIGILISIYFILVIVYIIRTSYEKLLNPKNIISLILTYSLFILGILTIFTTMFSFLEVSKLGYIKYGSCSSKFDSSIISTDSLITREYFYFTGSTFFLLGYGDICPMGLAKYLAIFTAFVGHLVSVIIVALIINNYLRKKEGS